MALDLRKVTMLKMKLMEAKELADVMNYFFDHLGESQEFINVSQPARHELLEAIIAQTVGPLLGAKAKVVLHNFLLLHVAQHQFYHGAFTIQGKMANVIYFDDIQMGCIAVALGMDGPTSFIRFSTQGTPHKPATPSPN
ncbi:MAG: hypothetical protein M3Q45_15315 [Chloroflexota bacterium]|nr:hypothetical protein [Chloroflexota bacterium]